MYQKEYCLHVLSSKKIYLKLIFVTNQINLHSTVDNWNIVSDSSNSEVIIKFQK